MTDPRTGTSDAQAGTAGEVHADQIRAAYAATDPEAADAVSGSVAGPGGGSGPAAGDAPGPEQPSTLDPADSPGGSIADPAVTGPSSADLQAAQTLAEERPADLQRLQAEFVNYRRRVERDRDVARESAVAGVLEALLPVLDDVHLARQHGDLESGPFAAIADKLEATLSRFGLARYGQPGEPFDPTVHEALVHTQAELAEGTTDTTVVQILQPGYRVASAAGEKVLRAARVAVADPQ